MTHKTQPQTDSQEYEVQRNIRQHADDLREQKKAAKEQEDAEDAAENGNFANQNKAAKALKCKADNLAKELEKGGLQIEAPKTAKMKDLLSRDGNVWQSEVDFRGRY